MDMRRRDRDGRTRAGVSLIELLVVIMIMAILMGVLLPTLPRIIDSGESAACAAHLKGVGESLVLFKEDHRQAHPVAKYMPPPWLSGDEDPPFNTAMANYLEPDSEAYRCPGDPIVYDFEYETEDGELKHTGMSYTFITALSGVSYEDSFFARFLNRPPTETPVLHDYDGGSFETQDGRIVTVEFFHNRRNVLYVDGHVGPPR